MEKEKWNATRRKTNIIIYVVSIILLMLLTVLICLINIKEINGKVIAIAYLIACIIFLGYALYCEVKRSIEYIWKRNDVLGLLICTVVMSILISGVMCGIMKWGLETVEISVIILLFIFTIVWFFIKYKRNRKNVGELGKTVQIMTTFITLVGIALTGIPNVFLRILFISIGCTYMIIASILQNSNCDSGDEETYAVNVQEQKYIVTIKKINSEKMPH